MDKKKTTKKETPNIDQIVQNGRGRYNCQICGFSTFHRTKIVRHVGKKHISEPIFGEIETGTE